MHYGEPVIRRSVPLALGLISASNPVLSILDTLSRYSHDNDLEVAMNAIFAMGLVGAGTNNAKLAQMLRQLASYYNKEADCLFVVRIAQVSSVPRSATPVRCSAFPSSRCHRVSCTWARARSESTRSTLIDRSCLRSLFAVCCRPSSLSPTSAGLSSTNLTGCCTSSRWPCTRYDFVGICTFPDKMLTAVTPFECHSASLSRSMNPASYCRRRSESVKPSTSSARQGSRERSLGSRLTRPPYDWAIAKGRRWPPKSIFRIPMCLKAVRPCSQ